MDQIKNEIVELKICDQCKSLFLGKRIEWIRILYIVQIFGNFIDMIFKIKYFN